MKIRKAHNRHLILNCKLTTENYAKIQSFPGFWKWKERDLWLRITPQNLEHLCREWDLNDWEIDAEAQLVIDDYHTKREEEELMRKEKEKEISFLDFDGYEFQRAPMSHQFKTWLLSRDYPEYALFYEQGLGKTKVVIDNAAYLYEQGLIDMLVIVAWPNGLHINWTDWEIPEDMPERIPHKCFYWKSNLTKKRMKLMNGIIEGKGFLKVAAFNVEAFSSMKARSWLLRCLKENRCMFTIDQSASIKNPTAKRTAFLVKEAAELAPYRRILDGAPAAENAAELFSQFYFLNWEIIGCDTFTAFKNEFCNVGRFNEIKNYTNLDRLMNRIEPYYDRVLEEDCLDIPRRLYKTFPFELTNQERKLYDEISKKSITEFQGEEIETPLAIVKAIRLQQISNGWWPSKDDFRSIEEVPSRLIAMKHLAQELKGKVLIFSRFKADIVALHELLPESVTYYGDTPKDLREENKKAFQLGSARWLIGNPATAGIGHTFTAAAHVVFYSNEYSLRMRLESEKRAHRKGQEKRLTIWDIIAMDTLDKKIRTLLKDKKDVADMIMKDPENFFLEESDD